MIQQPVVLLVLDGWGWREETAGNAIAMAKTPVWDRLLRRTDARTNTALSILCIQIDARAPEELKKLPDTLSPAFVRNEGATWLHRIPISPGAVLIDRAGIVRKTWFGVPSQRDEREIETALLGG